MILTIHCLQGQLQAGDLRHFLELAAARASGKLKGTVSSRKVTSGPVMSTRSGLEVVVLMSAGIVAGGESLACFPGRSVNIFVDPSKT